MIKKLIKEMTISGYGDYEPSKEMVSVMGKFGIDTYWDEMTQLNSRGLKYKIYKSKTDYRFIAGNFITSTQGKEIFEIDFEIHLQEFPLVYAKKLKLKKVMNVNNVQTKMSSRSRGIATSVYRYLVKELKYTILGDELQYFGARKLWRNLSKSLELVVDVIDIDNLTYINKDVIVKKGDLDGQFDPEIWSYNLDKKHIRLILKNIKS